MAVSGNSFFALDFGTSNTVALYYKDGQLMNVVDSNNLPYIPSMLSLLDPPIIGAICKSEETKKKNCENILRNPKLYLTICSQSQLDAVKNLNPGLRMEYLDNTVSINGISITELCIHFITKIKELAEEQAEQKFTTIVYSYPAAYDQTLIAKMDEIMKKCGFTTVLKIAEPVAAVTTYITENNITSGKILVIDIGGGTCDLSIVKCQGDDPYVVYKRGNNNMGGVNIDRLVFEWVKREIEMRFPKFRDSITDDVARKIMRECIEIKEKFSRTKSLTLYLSSFFTMDDEEEDRYYLSISRETFEKIITPFVSEFVKLVENTISESEKSTESVDELSKGFDRVVLVGGSSVIPLLQQKIRDIFPNQFFHNTDPRNAVVKGNYQYACAVLSRNLKERQPTMMPRDRHYRLPHIRNDEIPKCIRCQIVRDAINEPISVLSGNGKCARLLDKSTKFEETREYEISISADHQKAIQLFFCEGSDPLFTNNKYLGSLEYIFNSGERLLADPQFHIRVWMSYNSIFTVCLQDLKEGRRVFYETSSLNKAKQHCAQVTRLKPVNSKDPPTATSDKDNPINEDTGQYSEEQYKAAIKEIETKILSNLSTYIGILSELALIKRDHDKFNQPLCTLMKRIDDLKKCFK